MLLYKVLSASQFILGHFYHRNGKNGFNHTVQKMVRKGCLSVVIVAKLVDSVQFSLQ